MGHEARSGRDTRWQRRWVAGLALRVTTVVVPFVLGVGTIAALSQLLPRPAGWLAVVWYGALCLVSWLVLWQSQRVLQRLLPLAGLLDMAMLFPERAPSRLRLAQRVATSDDVRRLLASPRPASTTENPQEAAERVLALVGALATHDRGTRGHSERVRVLADLIAVRLGLSPHDRDLLRWAALLHDVGKLRVPASVLTKVDPLTPEEWQVLRRHPEQGQEVAAPLLSWFEGWGDAIAQHHERWDGTGYPQGLAGPEIHLGARIVAVADAYDAMTAARPYKNPMNRSRALHELVSCAGNHFDPEVVRALVTTSPRRLLLAMGPLSWVTGLPVVGQTPTTIVTTLASQTTAATATVAAVGAMAVTGMSAITPVTLQGVSSYDPLRVPGIRTPGPRTPGPRSGSTAPTETSPRRTGTTQPADKRTGTATGDSTADHSPPTTEASPTSVPVTTPPSAQPTTAPSESTSRTHRTHTPPGSTRRRVPDRDRPETKSPAVRPTKKTKSRD